MIWLGCFSSLSKEKEAVANYNESKAALEDIIAAATQSIESKSERKGAVAVRAVEQANLADSTEKEMGDQQAALAELLDL